MANASEPVKVNGYCRTNTDLKWYVCVSFEYLSNKTRVNGTNPGGGRLLGRGLKPQRGRARRERGASARRERVASARSARREGGPTRAEKGGGVSWMKLHWFHEATGTIVFHESETQMGTCFMKHCAS